MAIFMGSAGTVAKKTPALHSQRMMRHSSKSPRRGLSNVTTSKIVS
jgi:hypothetical protein